MRPRFLPLLILVAGFALVVRVGDLWLGLGAAFQLGPARAAEMAQAETPAASDNDSPDGTSDGNAGSETAPMAPAALATDLFNLTNEEIELLQRLGERRIEIEQRLGELDQRTSLLQAAEQRIDEKIAELKVLRETIEALLMQHRGDPGITLGPA